MVPDDLIEAGSIALRSLVPEPEALAAGLLELEVLVAGVFELPPLPVELFLLEQPLTNSAAAIVTTPATCAGRRRRSGVTQTSWSGRDTPGGVGRGSPSRVHCR